MLKHDGGKGVLHFFPEVVLTYCIVRIHGPIFTRFFELKRTS